VGRALLYWPEALEDPAIARILGRMEPEEHPDEEPGEESGDQDVEWDPFEPTPDEGQADLPPGRSTVAP